MRLSLVVLALSAALFAAGCSKDEAAQAGAPAGGGMPPPEVGVVVVQPQDVPLAHELVGRLSSFRSADVRARVPGVLQRRLYDEGSNVRKGQPLFQIDPAQLRATVAQARASLAQAQASAANAAAAADRARGLIGDKFISQSDYDNAVAAERSSAAAVQAARAAVQSAEINLGYATVRAPISGRAGKQQVTEGALVGQGEATLLTTIEQVDPMYVNFSMAVEELAQVRQLAAGGGEGRIEVLLPGGQPYSHFGTLDFSGDVVDPATGAVQLRARIPNPQGVLLPGSFVTVKAVLGTERGAFLVPQAAVQRDPQGAYVLVVGADGVVVRKDIVIERTHGNDWVVREGLATGDQVIVSGLQRAIPGQPAKAAPVQPDAAAPQTPKQDQPAATEG